MKKSTIFLLLAGGSALLWLYFRKKETGSLLSGLNVDVDKDMLIESALPFVLSNPLHRDMARMGMRAVFGYDS